MNIFLKILFLVSIIAVESCNTPEVVIGKNVDNANIKDANIDSSLAIDWPLGTWQNNTPEGNYTETWQQKNDSLYMGVSYFIVKKDTVFYESILLELKNNKWNYIVSVKDQNNARPISFQMTSVNQNQFIFENPTHDFPSKIKYNKITKDFIVAEISGLVKGKEQKQYFPMKLISEL